MPIIPIDELERLSKSQLESVLRDFENPIEVRRKARKYLNELMNTQPHAELYQTVLIVPTLFGPAAEEE